MLEPYEGKPSRTVLRGEGGRKAPDLPGAIIGILIITREVKVKRNLIVVAALMLVSCAILCSAEDVSSATWLHGKWELSYDPDESPKDFITFHVDGSVISSLPGNDDLYGTYSISGDRVNIIFKLGNKQMPVELRSVEGPRKTPALFPSHRQHSRIHEGEIGCDA